MPAPVNETPEYQRGWLGGVQHTIEALRSYVDSVDDNDDAPLALMGAIAGITAAHNEISIQMGFAANPDVCSTAADIDAMAHDRIDAAMAEQAHTDADGACQECMMCRFPGITVEQWQTILDLTPEQMASMRALGGFRPTAEQLLLITKIRSGEVTLP